MDLQVQKHHGKPCTGLSPAAVFRLRWKWRLLCASAGHAVRAHRVRLRGGELRRQRRKELARVTQAGKLTRKLGRGSVSVIEVADGLQPGAEIILSDMGCLR